MRPPLPFIETLIGWRTESLLFGKHEGGAIEYSTNNVGASQGIPVSAQLCIIYADNVANEYKIALNTRNIPQQVYYIRNDKIEQKCTKSHLLNKNTHITQHDLYGKNYAASINKSIDYTLFSDDACLYIPNTNPIDAKLQMYNNIANQILS